MGTQRGVSHYTSALLAALAAAHPDDEWRVLLPGAPPALLAPGWRSARIVPHRPGPRLPRELRLPNVVEVGDRRPGRLLFGAGALTGRPRVDRLLGAGLDVLWAPALAPLARSRDVPFVLTIHDLSWVERPRDFTPYERLWHRLARPARLAAGAARVMVDSEAMRDPVSAALDVAGERMRVVRPGVARPRRVPPAEIDAVRVRYGLPHRYLLFVGALEPRKAPEVLVQGFGRARERGLDAALAFAGEGRLARSLDVKPAREGAVVKVLGHVPAPDLAALYAGALALVLPSFHEGFGFTPLEALAHGTPSVCSDLPVLRESLGDGALWVPPGDAGALAEALVRIAADEELRSRLVDTAAPELERLTWERAAADAHAVLAEAARA